MANELIVTNAAALAALVDKTTGDTLTAAEYTTVKDSLQEANTATRTANTVFAGPTTGAAAAPAFRALVAADMAALRTFVKPLGAATNIGGGFFQGNLFRVTLGSPDSASGMLIIHAKIIDATTPKSGAYFYEVPIVMQRDSLEFGGNIATLLARAHFDGSTGGGATSIGFSQVGLAASAPNIDISLIIQPVNFTSPTVTMAATFVCPGDVTVTAL